MSKNGEKYTKTAKNILGKKNNLRQKSGKKVSKRILACDLLYQLDKSHFLVKAITAVLRIYGASL